METATPKIGWVRVTVALLLAFFDLAILIPSMGRIVVDHSTKPATLTVTELPQQIAILAAILLVGLAGIYFGARHLRFCWLEPIGWIILAGILIMAMNE
jgi:hypothetical protein